VARARVPRTGKLSGVTIPTSRASAPCKARWVWGRGREIFSSATCQLQFAKASAATLSQQEKNDTEDLQRGKSTYIRLYRHSGKLALAPMRLRRAQVVGRSFAAGAQPLTNVCTAGACDKTNSAWASGGPAGGRRVAACLGRWRALPQRAARREVPKPKPRGLQTVQQNFKFSWARLFQKRGCSRPGSHRIPQFSFSPAAVSAGPPPGVAPFEVRLIKLVFTGFQLFEI
jgi:hypothetical protein